MSDSSHAVTDEQFMGEILNELAERVTRGERLDLTMYAERYPDLADEIRTLGPTVQAMADLGRPPSETGAAIPAKPSTPPDLEGTEEKRLGDFRILRELGRGGMAVVYEAEQVSLKRRVALKVLPFAAVLDRRQMQRFKNEALAAAQLDHPHIVDVFGVGCERGVHHYAMRYIEGETLAGVIAQLKQGHAAPTGQEPSGESTQDSPRVPPDAWPAPSTEVRPMTSSTSPLASLTTDASATSWEFFRSVARLGRDVASALDYAHERGVVHRDIKPANIMLDSDGKAWVTDFGLARIENDVNLTMSGDLLGTLRYMSPEQVLGRRGVVDHRTDIYSLGLTLYELLTLRPAFEETDRHELLHRIATDEPQPPRQLNPRVPADLETIVLKATAKSLQERYETAQDLADDLERFLEHKPIRARRPTLGQRITKWMLRHVTLVWSAAAILLVTTLALAVSTSLILSAYRRASTARQLEAIARSGEKVALVQARESLMKAERHALDARREAYISDMRFAFRQWNQGLLQDARTLLDAQIPKEDQQDLRGIEWRALRAPIDSQYQTIGRHDGLVADFDFFPDGHTFATAGEDGVVRIWDADSLSLVREFRLQDKPVYTVGVSPDGKWLAYGAGSRDDPALKYVTLLDAETGVVLGTLNAHDTTIRQVRFSPDGRFLASSSLFEKVSIWSFTEGVDGRSYDLPCQQTDPPQYHVIQFLDENRLLTQCHDRFGYRVWNVENGEAAQDFPGLSERHVQAASWSERQPVMAYFRFNEQFVYLMDTSSGRNLGSFGVGGVVTCLEFGPDGSTLCVGTETGRIHTRTVSVSGNSADDRRAEVTGDEAVQVHFGSVSRLRFLDPVRVVSGGVDGRVVVFRLDHTQLKESPFGGNRTGVVTQMAASPGNDLIAWSGVDGRVRLADRATAQVLSVSQPLSAPAIELTWSGDGTHLAAICQAGEFCCWRIEEKELVECLRDSVTDYAQRRAGLAMSHDGSLLYVGGDRGPDGFHLWNVRSRKQVGFVPTLYIVRELLVSPDDRWLLAAWEGIFVFDRKERTLRHYLRWGGNCTSLLFAPDRQTLVAGYQDGAIRLWDADRGELIRVLPEYDREDADTDVLIFSPDARTLLAGDNRGRIRFWNTDTWDFLGMMRLFAPQDIARHHGEIMSLSLAPDGNAIDLTCGNDFIDRRRFARLPLKAE